MIEQDQNQEEEEMMRSEIDTETRPITYTNQDLEGLSKIFHAGQDHMEGPQQDAMDLKILKTN